MIILGIDPGTAIVGWGIIDKQGNRYKTIDFGYITTSPKEEDWHRLNTIYDGIEELIKKFQPQQVAVESLFYFKNQKTVMKVSQSRGAILVAAQKQNKIIREFTPLQIKQALTSYGRADKSQMQTMVKKILGLDKIPKPDDAADALACAICCAQTVQYKFKKEIVVSR